MIGLRFHYQSIDRTALRPKNCFHISPSADNKRQSSSLIVFRIPVKSDTDPFNGRHLLDNNAVHNSERFSEIGMEREVPSIEINRNGRCRPNSTTVLPQPTYKVFGECSPQLAKQPLAVPRREGA